VVVIFARVGIAQLRFVNSRQNRENIWLAGLQLNDWLYQKKVADAFFGYTINGLLKSRSTG